MNPRLWLAAFASILAPACGGHTDSSSENGDATTYGAEYQGSGVQCGAVVCSGTQLCCLVYISAEASSSGPTHACDQNCQSVCADTCPDAGGQTSMVMRNGGTPPSMAGMPGGMGAMTGGPGSPPPAPTGPMGGMGGPMGGGPMPGAALDAGSEDGPSSSTPGHP